MKPMSSEGIPPPKDLEPIRNGDQEAWRRLYDRYHVEVYNLVRMKLAKGRKDLTNEYTQEIWTMAMLDRAKYDGKSSFVSWVFTIARRIEYRDRYHVTSRFYTDVSDMAVFTPIEQTELDRAIRVSDIIEDLLDQLNVKQRRIIEMSYFDRRELSEIAEVLKITFDAARKQRDRAIKKLKSIAPDNPFYGFQLPHHSN